MASMVWAPKRAKGAAGAGFARASTRRLTASMAASDEDIAGMVLCGEKLYFFGGALYPRLRYVNAAV